MERKPLAYELLKINPVNILSRQWMLLAAGSYKDNHYNAMTIGWGSVGVMWSKPFFQVVVRPNRYTFEFMEQYDSFTVLAFPDDQRGALQMLGTLSGRDTAKMKECGLTAQPSLTVDAPSFEEAEIVFECRKMYAQDFDPQLFLDRDIDKCYPQKDYHRAYFGEILAITASEKYFL